MQSNLTHHAVEAHLDRKTHNATLSLMDWHPQNSDIKIMEAAKDHLESKWRKGLPTFSEKPSIVLQELWGTVPEYCLQKLQKSFTESSGCVEE